MRIVSGRQDSKATCSDGGARLMNNLRKCISSVGYSEFNKDICNFEKVPVSFFHGNLRRLWLEKLGTIEPFSGNLATCWSNIKEEVALEQYKLLTGNTVLYPEFQVYGEKNPADNWLAASPDGAIDSYIYELPSHGVLEIKCPFFGGDMSKAEPWKRVPLHYIPQAQGLMEILDRDWMDMYVWTVNGSSLLRIHRNLEYWDTMKIALSDFWWKHVQPAQEICSRTVITNPLIELRSLRPSPKHELHRRIVYESKLIVDNSELLWWEKLKGKQNCVISWWISTDVSRPS
ncbi:uncharacterized protein LOC125195773 isoform X3 [Salvia hispanica]|uniref:uncharacterized protein LOC125195773 isoform X3 n=1 Tax=Salvia hispanica TaxID=49212 RepID=UPI00200947BC|nr:uncharacterized protein LOC125195773 isoform X3 [Salvia hispanica]